MAANQLLVDFHARFTESCDNHQSIFIALLSVVFGVFAGFGCAFYKIVCGATSFNSILLTISGCFAILIFSFLNFILIYQNCFFYKTLEIIDKIRKCFLTPYEKEELLGTYGTTREPCGFYMICSTFATIFEFVIFFAIYFLQKNSLLEVRGVFALLVATIFAEWLYYLKKQRKG